MDYKRYRRYFIILDREDSGFDNKPGKSPKGYTKIEIKNGKGILSHFVQNLKYDEKAPYIYRGYLVGTQGKQRIYADSGSIVIDQQGKGELNWRFDPENVDGKGNPIDAFNVIVIVGEKLGTTSATVTAPMVGFIDKKKVAWKNAFLQTNDSQKQEIKEQYVKPEKEKLKAAVEKETVQEEVILQEENKEITQELPTVKLETVEAFKVNETEISKEEVVLREDPSPQIETDVEVEIEETMEKASVRQADAVESLVVEAADISKEEVVLKAEKEEELVDKTEAVMIEKEKERIIVDKVPLESIFEKSIEEMEVKRVDAEEHQDIEEKAKIQEAQIPEKQTKQEDLQMSQRQKGIFNQYQDIDLEQMKSYKAKTSQQYNQQNFKMAVNYIKNVLKHYEKAEPFESNLEGYKWWKIESSPQTMQRGFPPFYGYISNMYTYYPYMNYMTGYPDLIYKYQHYIFGLKADENDEPVYFVYGVPGKFALSEQPYEGMTGFVYWHSMQNKEAKLGDYGYWILHIDAKSGSVAMPLKPTPPPGY